MPSDPSQPPYVLVYVMGLERTSPLVPLQRLVLNQADEKTSRVRVWLRGEDLNL